MKLLSITETAEITGLSINTLYSYVCRKKIPHLKLGSRTLFEEKELYKWITSKKVEAINSMGVES